MIEFMEAEEEPENPFLAFLSFQAVHIPVQAPKEFVEQYKNVYQDGWLALRQKRFEKARQLGLVPQDMLLGEMLPVLRKWDELSDSARQAASNDMAVHAAMLEAMDVHIGRYIAYLKERGLYDNTVFVVTSDNGPEGGAPLAEPLVRIWMPFQGYHRDADRLGEKGYYGAIGTEFASATASPFAFFKTYTGEGGLRVPLIMAGKNIPQGRNDAFVMVTDVVPTLLDMAGINRASQSSEVPITGKSLAGLLRGEVDQVYTPEEPVGMESAGSAALFKGDWKIVRNAKPHGDVRWRLFNIEVDPGETRDLSKQEPDVFADLIADYVQYTEEFGVLEMGVDYEAHKVVKAKSYRQLGKKALPWLVGLMVLGIGWRYRKKSRLA